MTSNKYRFLFRGLQRLFLSISLYWAPYCKASNPLSEDEKKTIFSALGKLAENLKDPNFKAEAIGEDLKKFYTIFLNPSQIKENLSTNPDYIIWHIGKKANILETFETEMRNPEPFYEKGLKYFNGQGISQNYAKAFKMFYKAAELGHAAAQYNLGVMYENGFGVAQNHEEALNFYKAALRQYESSEPLKRQRDVPQAVTKDNYACFYGKVEAFFEDHSPLLGTGVALDPNFVLTLASCVSFLDKKPTAINFLSYHPESQKHNKAVEIEAVIFSSKFSELKEDTESYNFAILKLRNPLSLQNHIFPFLQDEPHYILHGFKGYDAQLYEMPISFVLKDNNKHLLYYQADTVPGTGGAPLLLSCNGNYYITGLDAGGEQSSKRAIWLQNTMQSKIEEMKSLLSPFIYKEDKNQELDFVLEDLQKLSISKGSTELNLSHNKLKPSIFLDIAKTLKQTPSITFLNLSYCEIDDIQALMLSGNLINLQTSLEIIDLRYNRIENKGAESLLALLENYQNKFSKSIKIKLKGNKIEESIVQKIKEIRYKIPLKQDLDSLILSSILLAIKQQQGKDLVLKLTHKNEEDIKEIYLKQAHNQKLLEEKDIQFISREWGIDVLGHLEEEKFYFSHYPSLSISATVIPPSANNTYFSEEELKDAIDIPAGGLIAPSEEATSQFIEQEGLNLLGTGQQASTKAKPRIGLSIDGGGIRGVMSALWLRDLSVAYQEDQEIGINPRLHQIFDYVGGTSIGGIVALSVAADLNPESIVDLFDKHGGKIFSTEGRKLARFGDFFGLYSYRYSSHNLEALMKEQFGEQTLEDTKTNILITACTDNGHPWLFKREDGKNYKLWEIARSTSAAPTYFSSYKPTLAGTDDQPALVDGGIWVNNPTTLVTASIVRYFNGGTFDPHKLYMLSLGTGDTEAKAIPQSAGKLHAAAILEALMNSHNRGNHMLMSQLLAEDHYYRINPKLKQFIDLSDAKSIGLLKKYAQQEEHAQKIKAFVEQTKEIVRAKLEQDYNIPYVKMEANSLEDLSENKISVAKVFTIDALLDEIYQIIAFHADIISLMNLSKVDQKRNKIYSQFWPWQSYLKGKFENNIMLYFENKDFFPKVINTPLTWKEIAKIDYFGNNHNQDRNDIKFSYDLAGQGFEVIFKPSGVGFIFKITPTTNQDILSVLQLLRAPPFKDNKVGSNFYRLIENLHNYASLIGLKLKWQSMHDGLEKYMLDQAQVVTKVRAMDILCSRIASNQMPHLESLDLTCNPIGNYGACNLAMALSARNVLTSLHSLRLKETRISDIGAFALGAMLRINTHIMELDLRNNFLTDLATAYLRTIWQNTNRNLNLLRIDHQQEHEEINVHYNLGPDIEELM